MKGGSGDSGTHPSPLVDGLFTWPSDEPQLLAGRCRECETLAFPSWYQLHAPNCSGEPCEVLPLGRRGILVSWTTQRFPPPPPFPSGDPFEPFAMGAVAFSEGIQIVGHLSGKNLDGFAVGQQVEVIVEPLSSDDEGDKVLTWRFAVVNDSSA